MTEFLVSAVLTIVVLLTMWAIWSTRPKKSVYRCPTPCADRLCARFGCPDSPEWIGDRK